MPLIKSVLETQILLAFQKLSTSSTNLQSAQQELASDLADAIDIYIKSATIITPPGQTVVGTAGLVPVAGSTITPATAIIT